MKTFILVLTVAFYSSDHTIPAFPAAHQVVLELKTKDACMEIGREWERDIAADLSRSNGQTHETSITCIEQRQKK